jgi:hypothetical protein
VLWGLAGKPVDDETVEAVAKLRERLEAVAKLREALHCELGEQAVRALDQPRDRRAAGQSRCAARKSAGADAGPAPAIP